SSGSSRLIRGFLIRSNNPPAHSSRLATFHDSARPTRRGWVVFSWSSLMRNIMLIAFVSCLILSTCARAQDERARTIASSGQAVVYLVPDEVTVSFGVETYDPSLDKSKAENDRLSASLVKAIKALGIDDKYIQADTMNIAVRPRNNERPSDGIDGYSARRSY